MRPSEEMHVALTRLDELKKLAPALTYAELMDMYIRALDGWKTTLVKMADLLDDKK